MKKYFNSFSGLRLFAFLNVFLLHIGSYRITSFKNNAAWAVSFFFMISGFLYGYKLYSKNIKLNETSDFSLKKITKIYPLYLITLIIMLPFSGIFNINSVGQDLFLWIKIFLYNITLTQSFAFDTKISYAFNGVSWFLSDFIFFMIVTIPIMIILKKLIKNKKDAIFYLIITIIMSFIYVEFIYYLKEDVVIWIYVFPLSRIFEYIAGLLLGIYFNIRGIKEDNKYKFIYTLVELIMIILLILSLYLFPKIKMYNLTSIWIIPNILIIGLFACEKGYISKFLGNKFFVHFGNLTFDAYLLHQVVNMYFYIVPGINTISKITKLKSSIFILIMTFLIAEYTSKHNLFDRVSEKINNTKI